jgi:GNAT superfamily N-acetyltransferase
VAVFLVARDADGNALGCGALLEPHTPGVAELKRMFTRPQARGQGVARALLERLEDEARARGIEVLQLETGSMQPEAQRLYESSGYEPIPPFGPYTQEPLSRCYERRI